MSGGTIRFEVDVIGHRPPYRWKLFRAHNDSYGRTLVKGEDGREVSGEADAVVDAAFAGQAAAKEAYQRWLHQTTKETFEVLVAPAEVGDPDLPVAEPDGPRRITRPEPEFEPHEFMD